MTKKYVDWKNGNFGIAVCGQANPAMQQDRVVGGWEAIPHQYPWMAALFIDDQYFCGGSIIDETHILTAAHCTDG